MPNPNQTEGVGGKGSGRNQQQGAHPERFAGDEDGRFSRDPAEGPRRNADRGPEASDDGAQDEDAQNR